MSSMHKRTRYSLLLMLALMAALVVALLLRKAAPPEVARLLPESDGIVYVNAPTIGAETHMPFGGTKQTGNGHREAAISAIDFYTEWKTLYIDYSDKLQRAQIDNN